VYEAMIFLLKNPEVVTNEMRKKVPGMSIFSINIFDVEEMELEIN